MHEEEWEQHFQPTRRQLRRQRNIAVRTDRSKFKTSDKKKIQAAAPSAESGHQGRVVVVRSQEIEVLYQHNRYICTLRGSLKFENSSDKNLVIVGDYVLFEPTSANTGVIQHVMPRTTVLSRQEHFHRRKQQLVASNVDQVIITVCIGTPLLRPQIIDRYLVAAETGGFEPVIIINKIDVATDHPNQALLAQECVQIYSALHIPIMCVSATTGEGFDQLHKILCNKTSVFAGQSGTGKTHIINRLTGLSLRVGEVRAAGKGAHTTSTAQLLEITTGGWCIDTPGIRSFGIFGLEKDGLHRAFPEIFVAAAHCPFTDCSHSHEEGCAVQEALRQGKITPMRFSSYQALLTTLKE
jgi:ribosome biogenesis GTPase